MDDQMKDLGSFEYQSFNSAMNEQQNFTDSFEIDPEDLMKVLR